jgi:hypothetical protein
MQTITTIGFDIAKSVFHGPPAMSPESAFRSKADDICSERVFRLLTH